MFWNLGFAPGRSKKSAGSFDEHRVTWGPYRTVRETTETDPDCSTDNPMFSVVEQPGIGSYLMPGTPLDFSEVERLPVRPAPQLGQHTDEILLRGSRAQRGGGRHLARRWNRGVAASNFPT